FGFWAPESRFLGFFVSGKLKKIDVNGGAAQSLCDAPAGRGGTWNAENMIVFSAGPNEGLRIVAAEGGPSSIATTLDKVEHAAGQNWAQFLPDGRHFLYYQRASDPNFQGVFVGEIGQTSHSPRVLAINSNAVYANGYLAYVRDGVLFVQPFDDRKFTLTGESVRIADHVGYSNSTFGYSAIAMVGNLLVYGPGVDTTTSL